MKIILTIAGNVVREIFRKKDFYVLLSLLAVLMAYLINVSFFGIMQVNRYLTEIGLAIVYLFSIILTIPFSSKLMIDEIKNKTIYPLLAKPVDRLDLVLGKFLGSLYASLGCFTLFFAVFSGFSLFKEGFNDLGLYLQVYSSGLLMLIMLNCLSICLSVFCTYSTSVTLSFMIFFLMSWFGQTLRESFEQIPLIGTLLYYLLPHFEFFDLRHRLVHSWNLLPFKIFGFLVFYCLIYSSILLFISYDNFKKKWL
jgi:ABC-type transport system involved in multi-copper enzyme maturation permease subunit